MIPNLKDSFEEAQRLYREYEKVEWAESDDISEKMLPEICNLLITNGEKGNEDFEFDAKYWRVKLLLLAKLKKTGIFAESGGFLNKLKIYIIPPKIKDPRLTVEGQTL